MEEVDSDTRLDGNKKIHNKMQLKQFLKYNFWMCKKPFISQRISHCLQETIAKDFKAELEKINLFYAEKISYAIRFRDSHAVV